MNRATSLAFVCGVLLAACGSSNSTAPTNPAAPSPAPAPAPAAPSRLTLSASPASVLLSGSSVTITARLTDAAGAPLAGRTIQLATSTGSLSSTLPVTGQNGEATATLTASAPATVLASASGLDASLNVPGVAPFTVTLDAKYSVIVPGDTDELFVTVTPVQGFANAPVPSTVTLACGNGDTVDLGDRRTAECRYREKGSYTATVTATSANGWSTTGTTTITAEPKPITLTLSARRVASGGGEVEMEFSVVGAPDKSECTWDLWTAKRVGVCSQNIIYAPGDTRGDGTITVSVSVDTKQGHDIQYLETTLTVPF